MSNKQEDKKHQEALNEKSIKAADLRSNFEEMFKNEAFVIGLVQATASASILATFPKLSSLAKDFGEYEVRIFLTLMICVLILSSFSAVFRWRMRVHAIDANQTGENSVNHISKSRLYNTRYQRCLEYGIYLLLLCLVLLILGLWRCKISMIACYLYDIASTSPT